MFTVHWNTFVPTPRLVIKVVGDVAVTMVPEPLIKLHVPVAGNVSALPCMATEVNGVHWLTSGPAFATGACSLTRRPDPAGGTDRKPATP